MSQQTYQRPPSSKQPHGMRPPSTHSKVNDNIPIPTKPISVNMRPTTNQGLPSVHTNTGTRQVADSKYYIGILRSRINETVKEIERLSKEIDTRKRGQSIQITVQQEVNELKSQIAQQEAELADYNVLADRLSNKVAQDEMEAMLNDLIIRNGALEKDADRLYREKKELDSSVLEQEEQVKEMVRGAGSEQLQETVKEIDAIEAELKEYRGKGGDLTGKSREDLLAMLKEATQQIGDVDRQIQDETKSLEYVQKQIKAFQEREADLQTERGRKYMTLLQREKEMTAFIQNFPQTRDQTKQEIAQAQQRVLNILNTTARDLECLDKMPTLDNYHQIKKDIEYKQIQMNHAESTATQLKAEVEQRRREYEDLQNVDQKIKQEEISLQKQMDDMIAELPSFQDVNGVREEGEIRKREKTEERDALKAQLKNLKKATNQSATLFNETKAKLRTNETQIKLHQMEKEIRQRALENSSLVEFIEDDRRKTNYTMIKRRTLNIVHEINDGL